jgi:hypothetical protein
LSQTVVAEAALVRVALIVMASGAIALLMPTLVTANAEATSAVMLTAVAALVATLVGRDRQLITLASSPFAGPVGGTDAGPPFLAARVTDTARHPVRPRAPGVV